MAIISTPGYRILDANGDPVSGGKYRVYQANTTTLATLYSDAAMATPRTNPVVANSAGELPFFFLEAGTYDVALLDASDAVLDSADDVPTWGEESGDLSRTVSGNGRFSITGAGGAVYFRAGSPDPDNVGGDLTLEGWEGTQLDTLTLDGATVNATGRYTEQGKKIPGTVYTAATAFASAAQVDIALPEDPDGVRAYRVDVWLTPPAGPVNMHGRLSYDGGANYKSGASDYAYWYLYDSDTAGGATGTLAAARDDAHTEMRFGPTTPVSNRPTWITFEIMVPDSGNNATLVAADIRGNNGSNMPMRCTAIGYGLGSYGRPTHFRLYAASGNIEGSYRVMPMRGFGE